MAAKRDEKRTKGIDEFDWLVAQDHCTKIIGSEVELLELRWKWWSHRHISVRIEKKLSVMI